MTERYFSYRCFTFMERSPSQPCLRLGHHLLMSRFEIDEALAVIETEQTTITFGAEPIGIAMAAHPDLESFDLSSLRYIVWGATPMATEIAERVTARSGVKWLHAYGATEAPLLHCNPVLYPSEWRLDSAGLPVSDIQVLVVDIDSRPPLSKGETGEILVCGPQIMAGYIPAEEDGQAFEEGWLRTGDIGWIGAGGWIHVVDRAKEMIKVNGFQVAPAEVERILLDHLEVVECAVFGMPDARTGESPVAAVVLISGATSTAEQIIEWVAERVSTYKQIREIEIVAEIPRTASGKVLRRVLRERRRPT